MKRRLLAASAALAILVLAGCSAPNEDLASQYEDGSGQGYISGDGTNTELAPSERDDAVAFEGVDENGDAVSSDTFAGSVYVVNFWYASCPPCRVEAPDLQELSAEYSDVPFLGVNTYDAKEFALTFAQEFGIEYPSILDAQNNSVQLAFAGVGAVAPNAVPTTLVMDREGRVAARISGLVNKSNLATMIDTVLAEGQ